LRHAVPTLPLDQTQLYLCSVTALGGSRTRLTRSIKCYDQSRRCCPEHASDPPRKQILLQHRRLRRLGPHPRALLALGLLQEAAERADTRKPVLARDLVRDAVLAALAHGRVTRVEGLLVRGQLREPQLVFGVRRIWEERGAQVHEERLVRLAVLAEHVRGRRELGRQPVLARGR
jgi:hypothetical protein